MEVPCTLTFVGQSQDIKKVQKLIVLAPVKSIMTPSSKRVKVEEPWLVIVESCPITFAVKLSPVTPSLYLIVAVCYRLILSWNTKHS